MPQNNQTLLEKTVADQWQTLPSGLTVIVRPMPGYSSTHVIFATRFGSIDRDFRLDGKEVHLPAGVAHFLEHKMFEDQDGDAFAKYAKTGANANAFTSFDRTCYLFTATQQLDESLDVLLGMVTHPYFTEQTIAKEQGIIGQEHRRQRGECHVKTGLEVDDCVRSEIPCGRRCRGCGRSRALRFFRKMRRRHRKGRWLLCGVSGCLKTDDDVGFGRLGDFSVRGVGSRSGLDGEVFDGYDLRVGA